MSAFRKSEFKPSSLLYPEENKRIANMLGHNCVSLETAVIQLYCTDSPHHSQWLFKERGVLCFVKDSHRKSYFFRLYCLVRKRMVWEQEIYKNMEYTCPKIYLGTFEGDTCVFAFSFASELEAKYFNARVLERIAKESTKALSRQSSITKKEKASRKKISKKEISKPIQPLHTFHVGFKNMDVLKSSFSEVESFFEKKNINKKIFQTNQHPTPSAVTPISVYQNENKQSLLPRPKLSANVFWTFQEDTRQDTRSTFSRTPEVNRRYQDNPPSLSKIQKAPAPNLPPKLQIKPPKGPLTKPKPNTRQSQSSKLSTTEDKDSLMSIEDSLAILDEVSNLIGEMQKPKPLKQTSIPEENYKSSEMKNMLEEILQRRNQLDQLSDSSFSDDNDTWDG